MNDRCQAAAEIAVRLHAFRLLLILGIVAVYAVCYIAIKAGLAHTPLLFAGLRAVIAVPVIGFAIATAAFGERVSLAEAVGRSAASHPVLSLASGVRTMLRGDDVLPVRSLRERTHRSVM